MNSGESLATYQTFGTLFGKVVPFEEIVEALAQVPLDQVLGTLNLYALHGLRGNREEEAFQRVQLSELLGVLARDRTASPAHLRRVVQMTRNSPLFLVHPHNAALLTHMALLHSPAMVLTPELTPEHRAVVLRLLLQLSDHLDGPILPVSPIPLVNEKIFALSILRSWQFQPDRDPFFVYSRLARYAQLYLEELPNVVPDVTYASVFEAATGVSLTVYFQNVLALVTHLFHEVAPRGDVAWMTINELMSNMLNGRTAFETLFRRWSTTADAYQVTHAEVTAGFGKTFAETFNLVALRTTPLIEARPDEFVLPVAHVFMDKMTSEPYFAILDALTTKAQKDAFSGAMGRAFERYAARLIDKIARLDVAGSWQQIVSPRDGGDELADVYLQRGKVAVVFELKALRLPTAFLAGLPKDSVLGPTDQTLLDHAASPLTAQQIRARDNNGDKGLVTRGMYQQNVHAPRLRTLAEQTFHTAPETVYPIIVHLADVKIDQTVYLGYLRPLMTYLGLYQEAFWRQPNWMHIEDLEALATAAEAGELDLEAFMNRKAPEARMDAALATEYPEIWMTLPDVLSSRFENLGEGARADLFGQTTAVNTLSLEDPQVSPRT